MHAVAHVIGIRDWYILCRIQAWPNYGLDGMGFWSMGAIRVPITSHSSTRFAFRVHAKCVPRWKVSILKSFLQRKVYIVDKLDTNLPSYNMCTQMPNTNCIDSMMIIVPKWKVRISKWDWETETQLRFLVSLKLKRETDYPNVVPMLMKINYYVYKWKLYTQINENCVPKTCKVYNYTEMEII